MAAAHIIYNPHAGGGFIQNELDILEAVIDDDVFLTDIAEFKITEKALLSLKSEDYVILCGGDGTLNQIMNFKSLTNISNDIFYYPCGSHNGFAKSLQKSYQSGFFSITGYLKDLPTVTVKGQTHRFLNKIAFGIDGHYRLEYSKRHPSPDHSINFDNTAFRNALSNYQPTGATILVDGAEHRFENVWLASTGFEPLHNKDSLNLTVLHSCGKPCVKNHLKNPSKSTSPYMSVLSGKKITVILDEPKTLLYDGESVSNSRAYTTRRDESTYQR